MKNIDSFDGIETRALFSTELTCVPPLWNHPKIVGVAQALLPVRFSEPHASRCSNQHWILSVPLASSVRESERFCQVTFVEAIS